MEKSSPGRRLSGERSIVEGTESFDMLKPGAQPFGDVHGADDPNHHALRLLPSHHLEDGDQPLEVRRMIERSDEAQPSRRRLPRQWLGCHDARQPYDVARSKPALQVGIERGNRAYAVDDPAEVLLG